MAEQGIKGHNKDWINIPPTPLTTFPTFVFVIYIILQIILMPLYIIAQITHYIHGGLVYLLHKILFLIPIYNITPITRSVTSYVIITGAASGIGLEIAKEFAKKGFSCILIDINIGVKDIAKTLSNEYKNQRFPTIIIDLSQKSGII